MSRLERVIFVFVHFLVFMFYLMVGLVLGYATFYFSTGLFASQVAL